MSKKAVCISCFHYYDHRIRLIEKFLQDRNYDCTYIISDFSHIEKKTFHTNLENCIQIPTKPYEKNLSLARLRSHADFARRAFEKVEELNPDFLFVMVPPNSMAEEARKYKKKHPQVKLVLDLYDLWPETFPSSKAKTMLALPFSVWRKVRDVGLPAADLVTLECELYRERLKKQLAGKKTGILYLCRPCRTSGEPKAPEREALCLCYLGSINNIIDIPLITELIREMVRLRPVTLHIIGDGESRERLVQSVRETGASVLFHGKIFDCAKKQEIFDCCHFGLNIMKDSVCVGLTMKSLDYFAGGLPILNTIEADTHRLVEERGIGINVCREKITETARRAVGVTPEENLQMRQNTLAAFDALFSERVFEENLEKELGELLN